MHPDRELSQMLVLAPPMTLRLYSTSNHRVKSNFPGLNLNGIFSRAQLSADGRLVVCGSVDANGNRLKFWDSQRGDSLPARLSEIALPYPVRGTAWHPRQHMLAVAMLGDGASLLIYVAEKESIRRTLARHADAEEIRPADITSVRDTATATASNLPPFSVDSDRKSPTRPSLKTSEEAVDAATAASRTMMSALPSVVMSPLIQSDISIESADRGGPGSRMTTTEASRREMRERKTQDITNRIRALRGMKASSKSVLETSGEKGEDTLIEAKSRS